MYGKIVRTGLGIVAVLLFVAALIGCGQSKPTESLAEPEYASAVTETTLQGLSENDLEKYTQYGNPEFKAAVTKEVLDKAAAQIDSQLGAYESKKFLYAEEESGFTIVHYKAKYAKGEVGIRMVFDQDHLVAGQWFE